MVVNWGRVWVGRGHREIAWMLATFYVSTGVVILWVYVCAKLPDASSRSVEFVLREMNCDWFKPFTKITSNYQNVKAKK